MEIKAYLRILLNKWWVLLLCYCVTFTASLGLSFSQPKIYEATAIFLVRPHTDPNIQDDFVKVLDIISRLSVINNTFAEVATSNQIKQLAFSSLALPAQKRKGLSVNANVIGGTNILEITIQGPDPVVVRDFANMVGSETVNYLQRMYSIFDLELLDPADLPKNPVKPNIALNLAMSAALGTVLGISLIFLTAYLQTPSPESTFFNILDRETGAYTKSYFMLRLRQEMSRVKRNKYPLSLGGIKIYLEGNGKKSLPFAQNEAMRLVMINIDRSLRVEDILARYDHDILVVLLPDMPGEKAKACIDRMVAHIKAASLDVDLGYDRLPIKVASKVTSFENYRMKEEQFLKLALDSLPKAVSPPAAEKITASQKRMDQNAPKQSPDDQPGSLESDLSTNIPVEQSNGDRRRSIPPWGRTVETARVISEKFQNYIQSSKTQHGKLLKHIRDYIQSSKTHRAKLFKRIRVSKNHAEKELEAK